MEVGHKGLPDPDDLGPARAPGRPRLGTSTGNNPHPLSRDCFPIAEAEVSMNRCQCLSLRCAYSSVKMDLRKEMCVWMEVVCCARPQVLAVLIQYCGNIVDAGRKEERVMAGQKTEFIGHSDQIPRFNLRPRHSEGSV